MDKSQKIVASLIVVFSSLFLISLFYKANPTANGIEEIAPFLVSDEISTQTLTNDQQGDAIVNSLKTNSDLDFESCNGNKFCIKQKTLKMKTFQDYDSFPQDEFLFMGSVYMMFYDVLYPADRDSITSESCSALTDPYNRTACNYAYEVRNNLNFDCSAEEENLEFVDGTSTTTLNARAICQTEKAWIDLENNTDGCSSVSEEMRDFCVLRLIQASGDSSKCDEVESEDPMMSNMCRSIVEKDFSIKKCEGDVECISTLAMLFPILSFTHDADCEADDADCTALDEMIRIDTGAEVSCKTKECVDYLIDRELYLNKDSSVEELENNICDLEDEYEREECHEILFDKYALLNNDIQYCVTADGYLTEKGCVQELSSQIKDEEGFCQTLGQFADEYNQENIVDFCLNHNLMISAVNTKNFSKCDDLEWPDDEECIESIYKKIEDEKDFNLEYCEEIDEETRQEDCEAKVQTMYAFSDSNIALCPDEYCVEYIIELETFDGDCSNGGDWMTHCLDFVEMQTFEEGFKVSECEKLENMGKCVDEYFDDIDVKNFDFEDCKVFKNDEYAVNSSNYNVHYDGWTYMTIGSVEANCYDHGVYYLEDLSGCSEIDCVGRFIEQYSSLDINCSDVGSARDISDEKKDELINYCEFALISKKAMFENDISLCNNGECYNSVLRDFKDRKYNTDYIKGLAISDGTKSFIFHDRWDDFIDDWSSYSMDSVVLVADDVINRLSALPEEEEVLNSFLSKREKNSMIESCSKIDSLLVDYYDNPLPLMCKQEIHSYFATSGEECGTEECLELFKDDMIDCSKIDPTFVDDYYDNTMIEMCEFMYEDSEEDVSNEDIAELLN